jgi:Family of unknown function (DUF5872)
MITNKKLYDSIVEKVKRRVSRWPSAYASGQVVREYKAAMGAKAYKGPKPVKTGLDRWYKEKWVDIRTGKPCGSVKTSSYYPMCRPSKKITSKTPVTNKELTAAEKRALVALKQRLTYRKIHPLRDYF